MSKLRRLFFIRAIRSFEPEIIYANSAATCYLLRFLLDFRNFDIPVISHIHELDHVLRVGIGLDCFGCLTRRSRRYIAASEAVRTNLVASHGIAAESIDVVHSFITIPRVEDFDREDQRRRLCAELGLEPHVRFVGGAGTAEWRKGTEVFLQVVRSVVRRDHSGRTHFLWIGDVDHVEAARLEYDASKMGISDRVHFLKLLEKPLGTINLFDVYALTSREDPYPAVVLEAAALGKPTVCFQSSGGAPEFVEEDSGFVVPYLDIEAMADKIMTLINDDNLRARLGEAARKKVAARHDLNFIAPKISQIIKNILYDNATESGDGRGDTPRRQEARIRNGSGPATQ